MHILITGGTGLIGTATRELLLEQGHRVTVLTRRARQNERQLSFIKKLSDSEPDVDAVINLAGAGLADRRWSARYKREITASRLQLTQQLVEWMSALEVAPKRLISASAIGYYGASETCSSLSPRRVEKASLPNCVRHGRWRPARRQHWVSQ